MYLMYRVMIVLSLALMYIINHVFEIELIEMCDSLDLLISDYKIFGRFSGQFTHVSNAHNTTPWLHHIICIVTRCTKEISFY